MLSSLQMYSRCYRVSWIRQGSFGATDHINRFVGRLSEQQRVFPFPDDYADCWVVDVLVPVVLYEFDVDEGLNLAAPRFLAVHARTFLGVILRLRRISGGSLLRSFGHKPESRRRRAQLRWSRAAARRLSAMASWFLWERSLGASWRSARLFHGTGALCRCGAIVGSDDGIAKGSQAQSIRQRRKKGVDGGVWSSVVVDKQAALPCCPPSASQRKPRHGPSAVDPWQTVAQSFTRKS